MTAAEDLDREAGYAAELLARAYREKGDADTEPWAAAFIALLRARGWRPTLARAGGDWRQQDGGSPLPDPSGPGGADYLALKAARGWAPAPPPDTGGGGP